MSAVDSYLHALQKELSRGDATEHTHRPALKSLIESSFAGLHATNEPKSAERENKPDYIIRKGTVIIGFVEAKDIDKDLKAALKTAQLKRYLEALPNLILTNYIDFIWFVGGEKRMEASLASLNGKAIKPAQDANARWQELIDSFCKEVAPTVTTPSQLAKSLAGQTRLLRDLSKELLETGDPDLVDQEQSFRSMLVPDLTPEEFADMYAQTAAYGLFTARVFEHTTLFGAAVETLPDSLKNKGFSLEKAAYLIPKANPFLRQFFQHVASPNLNAQLRWLVEQIADSLAHADIAKVLHRQSRKAGFEDPVFHFYETFLAEYDKKLRESRGVYYTPEPVVDYIVRSVDWLLKEKFGKPEGLADPSALILDPATGTATFLRKVIDVIHQRVVAQGNAGLWPSYVRTQLLPRIFGFELMMAPYTVAHLKLALQLQEQGFRFAEGERLEVYLTNTLDQLHQKTTALLGQWIARENEGAEKIKLSMPVEVVLGNPPYSGESRNKSEWIMELLQPYKTEPEGGPLKERNSKWINDDYVKFFRFAHDRVARTGHGIVAFITNHGWLDNPTFRGMRARLMADFDDIYVLDLHGNSKKKERTPDALQAFGDDKNVFDIEQGVSITFLVKLPGGAQASVPAESVEAFELTATPVGKVKKAKPQKLKGGKVTLKARIHQADLWGSREHKYDWLQSHGLHDTPWQALQPPLPQLLLVPRDESDTAEYERGWRVTEILPVNSVGIVTARDDLTIQFSPALVKATVERFTSLSVEDARESFKLGADSRDWRVEWAQADLKNSELSDQHIVPVSYRPFDTRYTYYTGKTKGFHCMPRGEVMRHLAQDPSNVSLSTTRSVETGDFTHVFAMAGLTTLHTVSIKEVNYAMPLWLLPSQLEPNKPMETQRHPNLATDFLTALAQALNRKTTQPHGLPENVTPEQVLAYIYAVLHAPSYRSRYGPFLKSDFPRIPLGVEEQQSSAAMDFVVVWEALLPLGKDLMNLHLLKQVPDALRSTFPQQGSNAVEKPRYEAPKTGANTSDKGRVWINATQYFDGVPPQTWAFKVGGYQVCEKWLKDRKGRELTFEDIKHYGSVVAALTRTRELMQDIDAIANGRLWPTHTLPVTVSE